MAWTSPPTFVTGNVLTAAQMNTNVRDNTNFLHSPPGCLATRATAFSVATGTLTVVPFNGTDMYDTDSMHDPSGAPNDIVINTSGVYLVTASIFWAGNGTGARWMDIIQSGAGANIELAGAHDSGPTSGIASAQSVAVPYKFTTSANPINVAVNQTSGGALSITNSSATTLASLTPVIQFGAQWISDGT